MEETHNMNLKFEKIQFQISMQLYRKMTAFTGCVRTELLRNRKQSKFSTFPISAAYVAIYAENLEDNPKIILIMPGKDLTNCKKKT